MSSSCQPSLCGDGVVTYDEDCDDGNLADGDCCSSLCTVPASCDDGNACTAADQCEAGVCTGEPVACGSCEACDPELGCHPALARGCRQSLAPWANRFDIERGADSSDDRLTWQWRRGEWTPPAALGDPFGGDDYTLCVFGPGQQLLFDIAAPANGAGGSEPGWSRRGRAGVRYRDWAARHGIGSLRVDAKRNGKATAVVHGEGASIGLPPLPLPLPLTVQLHAGDGACWEATYDAGGVVQDQLQLRARGSRPRGPRS
jgi:cysteine-rich repeat protein